MAAARLTDERRQAIEAALDADPTKDELEAMALELAGIASPHTLRTRIERRLENDRAELYHVVADSANAILRASAGDDGALERAYELAVELDRRSAMMRLSLELALAEREHGTTVRDEQLRAHYERRVQHELHDAIREHGPGTAACFDRRRLAG